MRYDAGSLHEEFGAHFRLVESSKELPHTLRNHAAIPLLLLPPKLEPDVFRLGSRYRRLS